MIRLISSIVYAFAASIPLTIIMGFVYYGFAVGMMNIMRRLRGEDHRGYYLISLALLAIVATFVLSFSFFVRAF